MKVSTVNGNLDTAANEADAHIDFAINDVFKKDLTDYTGEVRPGLFLRRTDRLSTKPQSSGSIDTTDLSKDPIEVTTTTDHGLTGGALVDVSSQDLYFCGFRGPFHVIAVTGPRTFTIDADSGTCGGQILRGGTWRDLSVDPVSATVSDFALEFNVPCTATPDDLFGSDCAVSTSFDALFPGAVREGDRGVWEIQRAYVYDGGADGVGKTNADNTMFLRQGVFVP
jgi:hypothetical protein